MFAFKYLPLASLLILAGCLPSSCRRDPPRELFAADSLSRNIAEQTPLDTLQMAWLTNGTDAMPLGYPRTVRYDGNGLIYVSDPEHDRIVRLDTTGAIVSSATSPSFKFSFLAGIRGDTALVFNPDQSHIDYLVGDEVVFTTPLPSDLPRRNRVQYAAASEDALYFKLLGEDFAGYIARIERDGEVSKQIPLEGSLARYAGMLRPWGDTLLSLTGFQPIVDVLTPALERDTMMLRGFDSPMLAQTRAYILGDQQEPPMLSASAAPAGDRLFVLNMRPGWLQVDVYDSEGTILRRLTQENPSYGKNFYPVDLDAWETDDGRWAIVVAIVEPRPTIALFYWTPEGDG